MKPNHDTTNLVKASAIAGFGPACMATCRKLLAQIRRAKAAIFAESFHALRAPKQMLRLALNEAEAAAFQTGYPHLVFPVLATEKVREVAAWNARQQSLLEQSDYARVA